HAAAGNDARKSVSGAPLEGYEFVGRQENQAGGDAVGRRSAPQTGMRLRLAGVPVGQRSADSGAIVAGSNGEAEFYRVGDQLPGNVELAEVEAGRILLRRGGRYESLAFEEQMDTVALVAEEPVQAAESPDTYLEDARARLDSEGVAALATYGLQPAEDRG